MKKRDKAVIGLVQMAMSANVDENLQKAVHLTEQAARDGAQIICLPELFRGQYFCQKEDVELFNLAESIPGPSTAALGKIAKSHGVTVLASLFEKRARGLYHNTVAILNSAGEIDGIYRKMHIPDDPAYYEKFYFTPGDIGFKVFETPQATIGTLICWDQWFPEGARLTAMRGADILFYPTAIGWHPHEKQQLGTEQRDAWRTIQRGHAIANGIYVAAVNRTGHEITVPGEAGIQFWGTTFLADPFGVVIAEASIDREETLIAEIDPARIEEVRRGWPFLRDRRIDAYGDITRRFIDGNN